MVWGRRGILPETPHTREDQIDQIDQIERTNATASQVQPVPETAQEAIAALQRGDKPLARALLQQALQQYPGDTRLWIWLSWAAETEEQRQECLQRLLLLNPKHPTAQKWLDGQRDFSQQMIGSTPLDRMVRGTASRPETLQRPFTWRTWLLGMGGVVAVLLLVLGGWWFWQRSTISQAELEAGYRPLLTLQATIIGVEAIAWEVEANDFDTPQETQWALNYLIDAKVVIARLDTTLDATQEPHPPAPFSPLWENAHRSLPTFDSVVQRWLNGELQPAQVPAELAPVRQQMHDVLDATEEMLVQQYGMDRERLREERETLLREVRTDPGAIPTPVPASTPPTP
jgi:hypothetical protein